MRLSLCALYSKALEDRCLIVIDTEGKNIDWMNEVHGQLPVAVGSVRQATLNLLINACARRRNAGRNGDLLIEGGRTEGPALFVMMSCPTSLQAIASTPSRPPSSLPSKAAVHRFIKVTLAGLSRPR